MTMKKYYHDFKASHRNTKRRGRHVRATRLQQMTAKMALVWVLVWASTDARSALVGA